jgi:ribosomal protein L12E/L44/L45/RPP1/RPP2
MPAALLTAVNDVDAKRNVKAGVGVMGLPAAVTASTRTWKHPTGAADADADDTNHEEAADENPGDDENGGLYVEPEGPDGAKEDGAEEVNGGE